MNETTEQPRRKRTYRKPPATPVMVYGKVSLTFHRYFNPARDCTTDNRKTGEIYVHHWGTGYQELCFDDVTHAKKWWDAEVKRIRENEQKEQNN